MSNISRSVYQKLKEENKRLLLDIKILVKDEFPPSAVQILVLSKWRKMFRKEKEFNEMVKMACTNYIKTHPKDKAVIAFHEIEKKLNQ